MDRRPPTTRTRGRGGRGQRRGRVFTPEQLEARRAAVPAVTYPPELPIAAWRDELLETIAANQVVIVAGETGSGKSTQLPKLCLELGRGVEGMIGHTQPRRLAARTVAERVAEELHVEVGGAVGWAIRFNDRVGDRTLVKVMTDGILLAELGRDRDLRRYDTLIIDEAHERSLNIDFILGYLRQLLPRRPDLKVIVTSATIDTERFAAHFGGAPVVEVSGRTYPVELRYRPLGEEPDDDRDQADAICDAVTELQREGPGDILVFLSGEREIRDTAEALADSVGPGTEVLPLYARLSMAEQHRVFRAHRGRRVVLATNVAETSLTVPGIRYVVDPGTARISRYNRRTKVQRLPIEAISQASADQRAGRCGRVGPGICIRLYAEDDLLSRPEFTEPEILRTNLAAVILQMAALGLGDVESFPFVEAPEARSIRDAVQLLEELGALEPGAERRLTPVGRRLARLPVDPRLGRMLLEAEARSCVREILVVVAGLAIQDVRERPTGEEAQAQQSHARFHDPQSDFLSMLALWEHLREAQRTRSSSQFRKLCRSEYLNHLRVREWQDLVRQLREVTHDMGMRRNDQPADPDRIHRALLAGLLSQVGTRDRESREYEGARQIRFAIAPGSALKGRQPSWVMAGELVETNRTWARMVAQIRPEWIEQAAAHLVTRSYGEPTWDAERGAAVTVERVMLYGLPVVAGRTVLYSKVDPEVARELFIQHALVEGDWVAHHAFIAANAERLAEVRALEDRARRRDLLVSEADRYDFFDGRVGHDVTSSGHFDRWWKQARATDPDMLTFRLEDLLERDHDVTVTSFPDTWRAGRLELDLSYVFSPGAPDDGVTVHVPLPVLGELDACELAWHVPGHRTELFDALIRSLPKGLRREFIPVAEHARALATSLGPGDGPLPDAVARALTARSGVHVRPQDLDVEALPAHLRMRVRVEGADGRALAVGTDLGELRRLLLPALREAVAGADPSLERTGMVRWEIDRLPRSVETDHGGHRLTVYPALVDEGRSVGIRGLPTRAEQVRAMWGGTRRLLRLAVPEPDRQVARRLSTVPALAVVPLPYPDLGAFADDCVRAALDRIIAAEGGPAWDASGFGALAEAAHRRLSPLAVGAAGTAADVVVAAERIRTRLRGTGSPSLRHLVDDVSAQLDGLVPERFVSAVGLRHLPDLPRYLKGIEHRLERAPARAARDRDATDVVQRLEREHQAALRARRELGQSTGDLLDVRWMLEELRVSLFAQPVGTKGPISEQRVRRALAGRPGA